MPPRITQEKFIKRSRKVHGNTYDYSKSVYNLMHIPVIIICSTHGQFNQKPYLHINDKNGCPKCGNIKKAKSKTKTHSEYLESAKKIHGEKYDYSQTIYKGMHSIVTIICPKHGEFQQIAYSHIQNHGCPNCKTFKYSKSSIDWLNQIAQEKELFIQHAENKGEYLVHHKYKNKIYKTNVDGYHAESNTIYEFHGCYFHGHPPDKCLKKGYLSEHLNTTTKRNFGELYEETIRREKILKELGYNLVIIWECQFRRQS